MNDVSDRGQASNGIGRAAVLSFLASISSVVLGVARAKVVAVVLGPTGVGITAQVMQLVALGTVPASMIGGPALVSEVATAHASGQRDRVQTVYRSAVASTVAISMVATALTVWVGVASIPALSSSIALLLLLGSISAAFVSLASIIGQLLLATGRLPLSLRVTVVAGALQAALVVLGVIAGGLTGQFAGMVIGGLVSIPIAIVIARKALPQFSFAPEWRIDTEFLSRAAKVGGASLIGGIALQGTLTVVRWELDAHGGPAENGMFQAAWGVATGHFGILLASLGNYAFPRYAAATDEKALAREVADAGRFVMRIVPPAVLVFVALRRPLVHLLYSRAFDGAAELLGIMMVGNVPKALAWVYGGPLLYRGRVRAFLVTELLAAGILSSGAILFVPTHGILGFGVVFAVNALLAVFVNGAMLRLSCDTKVPLRPLVTCLVVSAVATFSLWLTARGTWAIVAVCGGALIWAWLSGALHELSGAFIRRAGRPV